MSLKYLLKEAKYYKKVDGSLKRIFLKCLFAKTPLKKTVNSRLYSLIYSKMIGKKSSIIGPSILSIENTNICNAKCIMCPHSIMKRKQKVMKQKDFEKIVNKVMKEEKIKFVTITGFGEPLIDRGIGKKIEFVNKKYPDAKIIIFTNASLLTKELSEKLLKLKVFKINFSINSIKSEYKKIMGLDYDKTISNIDYFIKKKKDLKKDYPLVNVSLMVLNDNKRNIDEFLKQWQDKADSVMTYLPSDWAGALDHAIIKTQFKDKRWPCMALWKNITVDVEGRVIVCCRDYESISSLGNLLKEDYNKIKSRIKALQERHLKGDYDYSVCAKCDNSFDSSLDWWE